MAEPSETMFRASLAAFLLPLAALWLSGGFWGSKPPEDFSQARRLMVERDLKGRGIKDERVLEAMARVRRHRFVDARYASRAYADYPLPIGEGQTISQPYVVALMTQAAQVEPGEKVLEIGTGSGYQAAVLASITPHVYTIEIRPALERRARKNLQAEGFTAVKVRLGDGYFGWPEAAPFDAILVTAAVDHLPPPLLDQLADGGRLVVPLGSTRYFQNLTVVVKDGDSFRSSILTEVIFVPMIGQAALGPPD
jgi:protein-L-isoaspartate(D-aspartate) O-methyltransferase